MNKDDLEAARQIDQALMNLPHNYPDKDKAQRAFGRLILGHLGLKPNKSIIVFPDEAIGFIKIKYD